MNLPASPDTLDAPLLGSRSPVLTDPGKAGLWACEEEEGLFPSAAFAFAISSGDFCSTSSPFIILTMVPRSGSLDANASILPLIPPSPTLLNIASSPALMSNESPSSAGPISLTNI